MSRNNNQLDKFLSVLTLGIAIGAVASHIYRNNDQKIKNQIRKTGSEIKDKSKNAYEQTKSKLETAGDKVKSKYYDLKSNGDKASEIKEDFDVLKADTKNLADEVSKEAKDGANDLTSL